MKKILISALLALFIGMGFAGGAKALADPLARVRAYKITCDTTPRKLSPTTGWLPVSSFKFKNGAAIIYLGGSDVNTTTTGYSYAISDTDSWDASPGSVWCVSATSSEVTVVAGTKG